MNCGSCDQCCRLLEVEDLTKPANQPCSHLRGFGLPDRCGIYAGRPAACAMFRCLWLASQARPNPAERLDVALRPDQTRVVFYRSGEEVDPRTIFVHVDPAYPLAWTVGPAAAEVDRLVGNGAVVIVLVNDERIILQRDQPVVRTTEVELRRRAEALAP